jgi:hypothetical protein
MCVGPAAEPTFRMGQIQGKFCLPTLGHGIGHPIINYFEKIHVWLRCCIFRLDAVPERKTVPCLVRTTQIHSEACNTLGRIK